MIALLMGWGANCNVHSNAPILVAIEHGFLDVLHDLYRAGCRVRDPTMGETLVHQARISNRLDIVNFLRTSLLRP